MTQIHSIFPINPLSQNFHHNIKLVERLIEVAKRKGVTPGQLSIAWVLSLGPHMIALPGSS